MNIGVTFWLCVSLSISYLTLVEIQTKNND